MGIIELTMIRVIREYFIIGLRVTLETNQMYEFTKGFAKSSKNVFNKFFCVYFPPSSSLVVAAFAFVMFVEDKGIGKLYP